MFEFSDRPIDSARLAAELKDDSAGALVVFEGRVRDVNEGRGVVALEYEAYDALCLREAQRVFDEARASFDPIGMRVVHRVGRLAVGEPAIWIGVLAGHRGEGFEACRYLIDEIKHRLPIWKREHYADGDTGWVRCEACAAGHGEEHA